MEQQYCLLLLGDKKLNSKGKDNVLLNSAKYNVNED